MQPELRKHCLFLNPSFFADKSEAFILQYIYLCMIESKRLEQQDKLYFN
jgi:hypothetical protein